jgi:hypothetical protein
MVSSWVWQHYYKEKEDTNIAVETFPKVSPASQTQEKSFLKAAKLQPPHTFL